MSYIANQSNKEINDLETAADIFDNGDTFYLSHSKYTVPADGYYYIHTQVRIDDMDAGERVIWQVRVDGTPAFDFPVFFTP